MKDNVQQRLEEIRKEIVMERVSYSEVAELQSLAKYINKDDTLLLQWAGVLEHERCPKCGGLCVPSFNKEYHAQCLNCDEDFYSIELN